MTVRWHQVHTIALGAMLVGAAAANAQAVMHLSLRDAEQRAVQNHPQIRAAQYIASAADEGTREAKSAYFPTVFGSLTGVDAEQGTRIAAGGLNNPTILDRLAAGVAVGQLVTDFGRTRDLVKTYELRADAQHGDVDARRAEVLLQVDRAYFNVLRARSVETVARQTVDARQLVVDQVSALAAANLKSGLDVSFSKVNLGEAQLLLVQAQNDVQAALAALAAAIGQPEAGDFDLVDEPLPPPPPTESAPLVAQALRDRPDVLSERLTSKASLEFADAEHALWRPSVVGAAAAGLAPYRQTGLNEHYAAAGFNVNVPLSNGGLFSARGTEAALRAKAEEQRLQDLELRVARDVRTAWLDARTSFQRLDLTNALLAQATDAADLAQARYDIGLGSIVELSQAQLAKTRAQLDAAAARYDYHARTAVLNFQLGALK
jgi:outer membrane protein